MRQILCYGPGEIRFQVKKYYGFQCLVGLDLNNYSE